MQLFTYSYAKNDSESFLNGLTSRLKSQDICAALDLCRQENSSVGEVARSGIETAVNGKNVELAMLNAHDEEAMQLRARLNYLSMIITLAPLIAMNAAKEWPFEPTLDQDGKPMELSQAKRYGVEVIQV